ncbi:hypothetical protein CB1_000365048 [Camelus ferus]|nr:hypothetical protein CB1_000365048 [Camelus ferus]
MSGRDSQLKDAFMLKSAALWQQRLCLFCADRVNDFLLLGVELLFIELACFRGLRPSGLSLVSQKLLTFEHWQYPFPYLCPNACFPGVHGAFLAPSLEMDSHRLLDDQPIFDQLPDLLTGVGIGDFIGLTGVQSAFLRHSGGYWR